MLKGKPVPTLSHLHPEYRKAVLQSATALSKYTGEKLSVVWDNLVPIAFFLAWGHPQAKEKALGTRLLCGIAFKFLVELRALKARAQTTMVNKIWNPSMTEILVLVMTLLPYVRRKRNFPFSGKPACQKLVAMVTSKAMNINQPHQLVSK